MAKEILTDDEIVRILTEEVGLPAHTVPRSPPIVRQVMITPQMAEQLLRFGHHEEQHDGMTVEEAIDYWQELDEQEGEWFAPAGLNRELPPEPPALDEPEKLELTWKTDDGAITIHRNEDGMMRLGLTKWGGALYLTENELEQLRKTLNERHFCNEDSQEDVE